MGFTMGGNEDFAQLVANNECDNVWAICMSAGSESNGTLTIGGVDPLSIDGKVDYVDDVGLGFHSVHVDPLVLEKRDPVNEAAILDTGTNILLAPTKVMSSLQDAMCKDSSLVSCNDLWSHVSL